MEDLPASLLSEILSRLTDSADLARCRFVSKTLNAMSYEVLSLNHVCTLSSYQRFRSNDTNLPFKTVFKDLVCRSRRLESVSVGVDKSLGRRSYDEVEDENDDLYLTDSSFMKEWLPMTGGRLRSLSISDFWSQSSWRRSEALALISSSCYNLIELELKNTWLSVDGLNSMPKLINLTLEFIRLDDEDFNKINECFPGLQVLNLLGVGGLKEPKIELMHLKICHWKISNAPLSLTILAPKLVELKLKCVKPRSLVLETPSLSHLHLKFDEAGEFKVKDFPCLESLQLKCLNLFSQVGMFGSGRNIKMLAVDVPDFFAPFAPMLSLEMLFDYFPNLSSLKLGPGAWLELKASFCTSGLEGPVMSGLKEFIAHLELQDIYTTLSFISSILYRCSNLSDMALLICADDDSRIASKFISKCRADWPRVRWTWGIWKGGSKDIWVSDAF